MNAPAKRSLVRRLAPALDVAAAIRILAAGLAELPVRTDQLRRIEVPIEGDVDPLELPAGFPRNVIEPLALLGPTWSAAGAVLDREVDLPAALDDPTERLATLGWPAAGPELRFALSARFDPDRDTGSEWSGFGSCRVWLPALQLDTEARCLALNWLDRDVGGESRRPLLAALARWRPLREAARDPRPVTWRHDPDARHHWHQQVEAALERIADTEVGPTLEKIVLARRLDGIAHRNLHPVDLLRARPLGTVGWPWWLERDGASWLGESPELLGIRQGTRLSTLALAGTRVRHDDPDRDEELGRELLASDKDRREQAAVTEWLHGRLAELSDQEPRRGDLELARLPQLQHLSRHLETDLTGTVADGRWLDALHPSPALCGAPRVAVRQWLRDTERFDRGLYGGVIGWLQRSRADMYVAIRGILLRERQVSVYAGAGLVRGSDPGQEWAETGAKLAAVCNRLGLQAPRNGHSP